MNKLPLSSERIVRTPVIRIESLTDNQRSPLMVTLSGCYLNEDDVMVEYPSEQAPDTQEADRRVSWLRKQGFEFQCVKVSRTI